jgi:hypothetical protein
VAEAFGDVDGATVPIVEEHRVPGPEGGRTDADVDHEIEHRTMGRRHVLRLARRDVREMDAAYDAPLGHRGVRLRELQTMTDPLLQTIESIPLEEDTAIVAELPRRDLIAVWHAQFADLHSGSLPWAESITSRPRRRQPSRPGEPPT